MIAQAFVAKVRSAQAAANFGEELLADDHRNLDREPVALTRRRIGPVTIKDRLHQLVDDLSEPEADDALRYIAQRRVDPMVAAFRDAPEDDEPVTTADEQALAEVQADRANAVPRISFAEIKRKHG